ncbi:tRNA-binding protein [Fodinicola feengrottensis]|uniref:tRNA-binding domain-containing protein n=1 Tax=Fodinicola feengrottensis TaxID=435914 RepID=A0ABP4SWM0_9ACTN|nr:tRNA-binding protein [Fodinicola feengrottensis]
MAQHVIDSDGRPYDPEKLPAKPEIDLGTFFSVDLRVGRVLAVDDFPKARKPAWRLTVDFGPHVGVLRTSAQVTNYSRDELLGRAVVGAVNLPAKRIGGFESEFLLMGGLAPDGTVTLLELPGDLPPGSTVA